MRIHLDLDCYFVSAERTRYEFLKKVPVVVVKSSDNKIFTNSNRKSVLMEQSGAFNGMLHFANSYNADDILNEYKRLFIDKNGVIHGIVIAKSYEAKEFGIKTGTSLKEALNLCKDLRIIPGDHLFYEELSLKLRKFLAQKIPILEQFSIDEFFGELKGWVKESEVGDFIKNLQQEILSKFDLPISIAACDSKWIAKLMTDRIKPYGTIIIRNNDIKRLTDDILIGEFPGIGKSMSERLKNYNIHTLAQARANKWFFQNNDKNAKKIYERICGTDNEQVEPQKERKSIGISRNFEAISSRVEIKRRIRILARYLSFNIINLNLEPSTYHLKIKYSSGEKANKSITIERAFSEILLRDTMFDLFEKIDIYKSSKIHFLSMDVRNFNKSKTNSLIEHENDLKAVKISQNLVKIRNKYGINSIK